MFRKFFGGLLLCAALTPWTRPAAAQPPERGESLSGTITRAKDGSPIAGASVAVFAHTWLLQRAPSDRKGAFLVTSLLMTASRTADATYTVLARAPGCAPQMLTLAPGAPMNGLEIKMVPEVPLTVRAVTASGQGIADAEIQMLGFDPRPLASRKPRPGVAITTYQLDSTPLKTSPTGTLVLHGLPLAGTLSFAVRKAGYASAIHTIDAATTGPVALPLSRETVIAGKVLYADTKEPFVFEGVGVKAQMARKYSLLRQSAIGPDGSFQIHDIPSLELTGEPSLGTMSLELGVINDEPRTEPGVSVRYVQFRRNFNVLVTRENNGAKRWYMGYAVGGDKGVAYKEGERVQQDILLQPMARITGTVPVTAVTAAPSIVSSAPVPTARITYHDPRSIYADWSVSADENGRFEIFAPPGDVTLTVFTNKKRSQIAVTGLKAHETRTIEVP